MTAFTGEVHPLADVWPMLPEDEMQALADSISEIGLQRHLVVDHLDRLVDGRNRLAACRIAGVEPFFVSLPESVDVAAYIQAANAERRHLTSGQQAMGRALMLQAQGKRKNGRWERDSITQDSALSRGDQDNLRKAGLVLDVAARAAALGPDFADYLDLPALVMSGEHRLDYAYKLAQQFEGRAVLAEAMKTQPLTEAVLRTSVILDDIEALLPWPLLAVPLTKDHRKRIEELNRRARAIAAQFSAYAKENR